MSNIKKRLVELNPELFGTTQPSIEHELIVVGRKIETTKDGVKGTKIEYLLSSTPNAKAKAAGIKPQKFIHAAFKPLGTIVEKENGARSFSGPKKARTGVVFLNTQPDLYNFIKEGLYTEKKDEESGKIKTVMFDEADGTYKKNGFDAQGRPMLKMRDTVFGRKVSFNTDLYTPHSLDENGVLKPLEATSFDPKTGKYLKKKVVIGVYEFFADDDDLSKLLEVAMRHYQKNVAPFVTEKVTTITESAGKVEQKVEEAEVTQPDALIFDADGNSVDENGEILESREDLEARGVEIPD